MNDGTSLYAGSYVPGPGLNDIWRLVTLGCRPFRYHHGHRLAGF